MPSSIAKPSDFEAFLNSAERSEECLNIQQAQGAMVAYLSSPEYFDDLDMVELILGYDNDEFSNWLDNEYLEDIWVQFRDELLSIVMDDIQQLVNKYPIDETSSKPTQELMDWCDGYLRGYMITEDNWKEAHEFLATEGLGEIKENHDATLSILATFATWDEALEEHDEPQQLTENVHRLHDTLWDGITIVHKLALLLDEELDEELDEDETEPMNNSIDKTYHRETKTGRNELCPCGSGKKYKKCCLDK